METKTLATIIVLKKEADIRFKLSRLFRFDFYFLEKVGWEAKSLFL